MYFTLLEGKCNLPISLPTPRSPHAAGGLRGLTVVAGVSVQFRRRKVHNTL
jgi:hypothetical protein